MYAGGPVEVVSIRRDVEIEAKSKNVEIKAKKISDEGG